MQQTAYTGINNLYSKLPYIGGLCKFWFIPIQDVESIPLINPVNSYLLAEPVLKATKTWFGPVPIPDRQLGYTETQENTAAGPSYKLKIAGNHYGDAPQSRVNIENITYGKYLVVGKQRAGGFYLLFGTTDSPLNFDNEFTAGQNGANDTAFTKIAFTGSSINKALVIPSFLGDASGLIYPGGPGGGGGTVHTNETEIIYFTSQTNVSFTYTTARRNRFGDFPCVECWIIDPSGTHSLSMAQPYIDGPPPSSFTTMFYEFGGPQTGFIVLK
jgi:hypothetical protein